MKAREQERAFAEKLRASPHFLTWFLDKTKFKDANVVPILVQQSETDILAVFESKERAGRFGSTFLNGGTIKITRSYFLRQNYFMSAIRRKLTFFTDMRHTKTSRILFLSSTNF